ncbi:MAG: hypothetical protein V2A73_01010, partial [Pseudomonadota bacterium]
RPFIGVPCHRRAADCCGENSTSKEEWNKELGTRHREQHNQRLLFTPGSVRERECKASLTGAFWPGAACLLH